VNRRKLEAGRALAWAATGLGAVGSAACAPQVWSFDEVAVPADASAVVIPDESSPSFDATVSTDPEASTNIGATASGNASTGGDPPANASGDASTGSGVADGGDPSMTGDGESGPPKSCISDPRCWSCSSDKDCTNSLLPVCDTVAQRCVECVSDCRSTATGARFTCVNQHCVVRCTDSSACGQHFKCNVDAGICMTCDVAFDHFCDGNRECNADGLCVDCVSDDRCPGETCSANGYCLVPVLHDP
jgi:hypothetical protein